MSIPEIRIVDGFRFAVVPAVPGTFCNTAVRMLPSETQPEQALRRQAAENREHAAALLEEAKLLEKALEPWAGQPINCSGRDFGRVTK